jgi:hypothetical protein
VGGVEHAMRGVLPGPVLGQVPGYDVASAAGGWFEGHLKGEDTCAGCDFRGEMEERGILREIWLREALPRARRDDNPGAPAEPKCGWSAGCLVGEGNPPAGTS